jgi:hypothetical protein
MKRRQQWQPILESETKRWKAKSWETLVADLAEEKVYEVRI